eukprot:4961123-Amphidinium_carterae.1
MKSVVDITGEEGTSHFAQAAPEAQGVSIRTSMAKVRLLYCQEDRTRTPGERGNLAGGGTAARLPS